MIKSLLIARSLITFILLNCWVLTKTVAQEKKLTFNAAKNKVKTNQFLDQQWWLGFKAGTTLAEASPRKRYTILTPTNYSSDINDKKYGSFKQIGIQTTVEITYYYKGFYFSVQPSYASSIFSYSNGYKWTDIQNSSVVLAQRYEQEQKVETADFPFIVKYDIAGNKLRPFAQVGVYYSLVLNATKNVTITNTDQAAGGVNQVSGEPLILGVKDLFNNHWGVMGGVGLNYQPGNVRLTLEANYRQTLSNITNAQNRFSNDRLAGIGEAQDDLHLRNISITAGILFPLRYISKTFKSNDR